MFYKVSLCPVKSTFTTVRAGWDWSRIIWVLVTANFTVDRCQPMSVQHFLMGTCEKSQGQHIPGSADEKLSWENQINISVSVRFYGFRHVTPHEPKIYFGLAWGRVNWTRVWEAVQSFCGPVSWMRTWLNNSILRIKTNRMDWRTGYPDSSPLLSARQPRFKNQSGVHTPGRPRILN